MESIKSRLLLVEDNTIAAQIAQNILVSLDYSVDVAYQASEAICLAEQHDYDLIFMDIGLPDSDGYQLTAHLRTYLPAPKNAVPILALSAYDDAAQQEKCLAAGMTAALIKPLTKAKALEALQTYLPDASPVIDLAVLHKYISSDPRIYLPLLEEFLTSLPEQAAVVSQAMQDQNWVEVAAKAHKLNGGAKYCGAMQLSAICEQLQRLTLAPDAQTQLSLQNQWQQALTRVLHYTLPDATTPSL